MKKVILILASAVIIGFANKAELVSEDVLSRWLSIGTDSTGRPHLAYGLIDEASSPYSWRISYAVKEASWQKEVVDSSKAVSHSPAGPPDISLALDADDKPAMVYWKNIVGDSFSFASKQGASWQVENILETYPSWPILRFDETMPFIVYAHHNDDSDWVFVGSAGQSPTGWVWDSTGVKERINEDDKVLDFVWDSGDRAQILYIYASGTGYKRLVRPLSWDGDWTYASPIDSTGSDPRESGVHVALSPNGTVGAAFAHQDDGGSGGPYALYYVTHTGSAWGQPEIADTFLMKTASASTLNCGPSLAYDTLNRPHIVYVSEGSGGGWILAHAYKQASTWYKETLDTLSDLYLFRAEASVDRLNRLHVAYIAGGGTGYNLYYLAPGSSGVADENSEIVAPELKAFFNPATGEVRFTLDGTGDVRVNVYDSAGTLVQTVTLTGGTGIWNTSGSARGVYFARANTTSSGAVKIVTLQ